MDPNGILDVENADVNVTSNINLNFDWGTIGIIGSDYYYYIYWPK